MRISVVLFIHLDHFVLVACVLEILALTGFYLLSTMEPDGTRLVVLKATKTYIWKNSTAMSFS